MRRRQRQRKQRRKQHLRLQAAQKLLPPYESRIPFFACAPSSAGRIHNNVRFTLDFHSSFHSLLVASFWVNAVCRVMQNYSLYCLAAIARKCALWSLCAEAVQTANARTWRRHVLSSCSRVVCWLVVGIVCALRPSQKLPLRLGVLHFLQRECTKTF